MRLLLDENLPKKFKREFADYEIYTVRDKGWNGIKNGELLKLILADGIDALITVDKNMRHQQNFQRYPITVLVLDTFDNTYSSVTQFTQQINEVLRQVPLPPGVTVLQL